MSAFDQLAEPVQKWIWAQKWSRLRDVQERAIPSILSGGDTIIAARTAAGKTEAAFLPLLTRVLRARTEAVAGFDVVYVSPLKALINDQSRRLESLAQACDLPLHRWHGDVSADAKQRARTRPSGIVLITPESLEATLVRRGNEVEKLFASASAIVIDELHAFVGRERGMQLQSILARIEMACRRPQIDRIGLSATLGDMQLAAEFLRPGAGKEVSIVVGADEGNGLKLQVRGYVEQHSPPNAKPSTLQPVRGVVNTQVANDLFRFLRGQSNLLFAGSRQRVEGYTDALREMCEQGRLPNEFFAHHGNLSRAQREDIETRLRDDPRPTTAVATTTLELGIDVGDVVSIAQIGPGFSVSSLRQRLGRSGRREGNPAQMRIFVVERDLASATHPVDRLRLDLVQAIAIVECMLRDWCEPPMEIGLHLSTLVHQTLALILQWGAIEPAVAHRALCEVGPFRRVGRDMFADLLRAMAHASPPLIEMSVEGQLMLGEQGERLTATHEFYPIFETPIEYRVITGSQVLGTLPMDHVVAPGQTLIFSGRRWRATVVDDRARVIQVEPTKSALPPTFGGDFGGIHDTVVDEMRRILKSTDTPAYLDKTARQMLADGRAAFLELELDRRSVIPIGRGVMVFPWVGTRSLDTLCATLVSRQYQVASEHHCLEIDNCDVDSVRGELGDLAAGKVPDARDLASGVSRPFLAKFDRFLSPELLTEVTLAERLDASSLPRVATRCL